AGQRVAAAVRGVVVLVVGRGGVVQVQRDGRGVAAARAAAKAHDIDRAAGGAAAGAVAARAAFTARAAGGGGGVGEGGGGLEARIGRDDGIGLLALVVVVIIVVVLVGRQRVAAGVAARGGVVAIGVGRGLVAARQGWVRSQRIAARIAVAAVGDEAARATLAVGRDGRGDGDVGIDRRVGG